MLHTPIPFPHSGSVAYLAPNALKVKIVQHKPGGQVLVTASSSGSEAGAQAQPVGGRQAPVQHCCNPAETAFNSRTVPLTDLYPDGEAAMLAGKPARKSRRRLSPSYSSPRT